MCLDRRFFLRALGAIGCSSPFFLKFLCNKSSYSGKYKIFYKKFFSMGTMGKICVVSKDDDDFVVSSIDKALNRIYYLEKLLTKFSSNSDIGKLNKFCSNVSVSNDTKKILQVSCSIHTMTNNYFNIGVNSFFSEKKSISDLFSLNVVSDVVSFMYPNKVSLKNGYRIDLGGIGKGFAVQEAMNVLSMCDVKYAFVDLGGDAKVYGGLPGGKPWEVCVYKHNTSEVVKKISLHTGSVSTSGLFLNNFTLYNKKKYNKHIFDPKTFSFKNYYKLVTTIGEDTTICDALSTACFNVPPIYLREFTNSFKNYAFYVFK